MATVIDFDDVEREAIRGEAEAQKRKAPRPLWPMLRGPEILEPLPPVDWLCEGLGIAPGPPTLVAGYGYSGKTAACQALALSIATGCQAWGRYPVRQGRVLHLDYEQGRHLTVDRYQRLMRALCTTVQITHEQLARLATELEVCVMPPAYLDTRAAEDELVRHCEGHALCLIDSYRAACPGIDENASEARVPLDRFARVSERTGCTIIVIHHARKAQQGAPGGQSQTIRGSGAIYDACQTVLILSADSAPKAVPGRNFATLDVGKDRLSGKRRDASVLSYEDLDEHGQANPEARHGLLVTARDAEDVSGDAAERALDVACDRVLAFVRGHAGCSSDEVHAGVTGNKQVRVAAMRRLERGGAIVNRGGAGGRGSAAAWFPVGAGGVG